MKKAFYLLVLIFLFLQFFQIDKVNPPVNNQIDFLHLNKTPDTIATVIRNSCYDCHSNETTYPWYSYVQPAGWFLESHIKEGRRKLNFSMYGLYDEKRKQHKIEEAVEMVEKEKMPLDSYTMIHGNAQLTPEQRKALVEYFKYLNHNLYNNK